MSPALNITELPLFARAIYNSYKIQSRTHTCQNQRSNCTFVSQPVILLHIPTSGKDIVAFPVPQATAAMLRSCSNVKWSNTRITAWCQLICVEQKVWKQQHVISGSWVNRSSQKSKKKKKKALLSSCKWEVLFSVRRIAYAGGKGILKNCFGFANRISRLLHFRLLQ